MGLFDSFKKSAVKDYIKQLENKGVYADKNLQSGANKNKLKELEDMANCLLPDSFKNLYTKYNGEKESLGFIAGFEFLSIEKVIDEYSFFKL